jgi:hypothetical protein
VRNEEEDGEENKFEINLKNKVFDCKFNTEHKFSYFFIHAVVVVSWTESWK